MAAKVIAKADLPKKQNAHHVHLNRHPVVRIPKFKKGTLSAFNMRTDGPTNLLALMIQATGPKADHACSRCVKDTAGVWETCVRPPCETIDNHVHGACANCAYRGRAADCSASRKWKMASKGGMVANEVLNGIVNHWATKLDDLAQLEDIDEIKKRVAKLAHKMRHEKFEDKIDRTPAPACEY